MIRELFPYDTARDAFSIDYKKLYDLGYRGLLFDIDNTLVHHGDDSTPEVDAFFKKIRGMGFQVLMLSNNSEDRIRRFLQNIDALYISDADKPLPEGYKKACRMMGIPIGQAVMIGDQLFTDIRGANRCGMASILVHFIEEPGEKWLGWHRYAEFLILIIFRIFRPLLPGLDQKKGASTDSSGIRQAVHRFRSFLSGDILFCEISPAAYKLSVEKEILKKRFTDLMGKEVFAHEKMKDHLPLIAAESRANIIKRGPGVDPTSQQNKAVNMAIASRTFNHLVIHPGETFSFWKNVGRTTRKKGYKDGRVIVDGKLITGVGGGLCNLANTLHLLVRQTPLTVTELHFHSDALAPDEGPRKPFANGTSVSYSNIDFRFTNNTDQDFQIIVKCEGEMLYAQLRCEHAFPYTYKLAEEDHHFCKEGDKYYRVSRIYHETYDKETNELLQRKLIRDNHSEVMYDPELIPEELLRV